MDRKRKRILAIDGGGIYGLTSALWLRKLCEADANFLNGEDIHLFAGCSSGAVNSLLLAKSKVPREAVLSGELERFWHDPGTFSNTDPVGQWLSFMELSGWYGERDFLDLLLRYFGEMTLGELHHKVLISTFNWSGRDPQFPPLSASAGVSAWDAMNQRKLDAKDPWKDLLAQVPNVPLTALTRRWRPQMFHNVGNSKDSAFAVAEIAYGAATPPGFRALRGGIGDGASFSASPSVDAIAFVVQCERKARETHEHTAIVQSTLADLSVLGLGDGTFRPYHFLPNSNLGFLTWGMVPSNPLNGVFFPPNSYSLQPADEEATLIASELLGESFFRLNPSVMEIPTVTAAYLAKWPSWRNFLLKRIQENNDTPPSLARIADATKFLQSKRWLGAEASE